MIKNIYLVNKNASLTKNFGQNDSMIAWLNISSGSDANSGATNW